MSRDIVADIVRNALSPEPISKDGAPRETPFEERLRLLHNALGGTRDRVAEQQAKLEKLRAEMDEYRALMEQVKRRAVAMERAAEALPPPPPPPPAPVVETTPVFEPAPVLSVASVLKDSSSLRSGGAPVLMDALAPRMSWRQVVPYAAIALFGAGMSLLVTRHPAQTSLKLAAVPPPSLTAEPNPLPAAAAPAQPALSDEESNAEVIALVSAYVPPGTKRSVSEILGPELDDPSTESPWTIMRVDERTTLVSFRPYGEVLDGAPVYEFTVDPVAKSVSAGAETVANLQSGATTASR